MTDEKRAMYNPFKYTDRDLYELMHEQGKKRFGSECKHEHIKNGYCKACLRKIYNINPRKS